MSKTYNNQKYQGRKMGRIWGGVRDQGVDNG